jgi:hypothetical protein
VDAEVRAAPPAVLGALAINVEGERFDRDVHRSPPDLGFRIWAFDAALILGRATGLDAGVGRQRAIVDDAGILFVADGMLIECAYGKVAVDFSDGDAVLLEVERNAHRRYFQLRFEGLMSAL